MNSNCGGYIVLVSTEKNLSSGWTLILFTNSVAGDNFTMNPSDVIAPIYCALIILETFKKNAKELKEIILTSSKIKNINRFYTISGLYNMSFYVNFDEILIKLIMNKHK